MTTLAPPAEIILSLNFTGGLPAGRDFVPSVIMIAAYVVTLPVLVWRLASRQSRDPILYRVALFAVLRTGSLTLRAAMAKSPYSLNMLIAQLVLFSIGFLVLVEPLVALWKLSVDCNYPPGTGPRWVTYLHRTLQFALVAALTAGIIASTQIAASFQEGGQIVLKTLTLRQTSYSLSFAVVMLTALAIGFGHFKFSIPIFRTIYLLIVTLLLAVTATYRVSQSFSKYTYSPMRSPAAFYFCQVFFEFITYLAFIIVSIPDAFPTLLLPTERKRSLGLYTEKPTMRHHTRGPSVESPVEPTIRVRPRPLSRISRKPVPGSESSETVNTMMTSETVHTGRVSPLTSPLTLIDLTSPARVDDEVLQERMMPLVPIDLQEEEDDAGPAPIDFSKAPEEERKSEGEDGVEMVRCMSV